VKDEDPTQIGRSDALLPAQTLGPCRLLRHLGSGGMGTVYLAEMLEDRPYAAAGTVVAVKVLRSGIWAGENALNRFARESRLGISIEHPAVVRAHEISQTETGRGTCHYLIQEYVEGRTLRDLMNDMGVIPEALLRDLGAQIAQGLGAIHGGGAVHRDLKPGNIMITPDHRVKIMDLGIAKLLDATTLTTQGVFVGTLWYAAPEQFREQVVGPAADLYALGIILFEGATGRLPFESNEPAEVIRCHLEERPPRVGQIEPRATPFLEELVASLLEKDPAERFSSAGELAGILEEGEGSAWWSDRQEAFPPTTPRAVFARIQVPRETALVGREEEMEMLSGLFREAKEGNGRLLVLEGEAGVGKTRLLDGFLQKLEACGEDAQILYGAYSPGGIISKVGALAEAVLHHYGEADLQAKLSRHLPGTRRLVPAFCALITGATAPPGSEALSEEAIHALFMNLILALGARGPTLLILEDLHLSPPQGLGLLLALGRVIHDQRIFIVATSRPGLPHQEMADLQRLRISRRVSLQRLAAEDVTEIVREALGSDTLAVQFGPQICARYGGNPFFVFEILRELREGGFLQRLLDGSCTLARVHSELEVPSSVRELLLARLEGLKEEERTFLDVGAVQGNAFDPDLIARVLERKRLEVLQSLAEVQRRPGMLRGTGTGFEFDHQQLREVLYDSLPSILRMEYHRLLAEAFESKTGLTGKPAGEVPSQALVFLAEQYLRAGESARAAALVIPALSYLAAGYRHQALLDLADLALDGIGPGDGALRFQVRSLQAECLDFLGRREAQRTALEDAAATAESIGDERKALRARMALAGLLIKVSDYVAADGLLQDLRSRAKALEYREMEARAASDLGLVHLNQGDYQKALEAFEEAIHLAHEMQDRHIEARAAMSLGTALRHLGKYDEAREHYERWIHLFRESDDLASEAKLAGNLANLLIDLGQYESARKHLERQMHLCREVGYLSGEVAATGNLGLVLTHLGQHQEARTKLERSLTLCLATDYRKAQAVVLGNLGSIAVTEGRLEQGEQHLRQCLDLSRELRIPRVEGYALLDLGDLARTRSEPQQARSFFGEALEVFERLDIPDGTSSAALALGRVLLESGDREEALARFREADDLASRLSLGDPGMLPRAYLSLLGDCPPGSVTVNEDAPARLRAETHLVLERAGADGGHLQRARQLLETMSVHLEGEDRSLFWTLNPVARALLAEEGAEAP